MQNELSDVKWVVLKLLAKQPECLRVWLVSQVFAKPPGEYFETSSHNTKRGLWQMQALKFAKFALE